MAESPSSLLKQRPKGNVHRFLLINRPAIWPQTWRGIDNPTALWYNRAIVYIKLPGFSNQGRPLVPKASRRNRGSRVTLKEIAVTAEVSTATVSRVLNDTNKVSPELAQRVREVANCLEYTPNRLAANLRQAHSTSVGLITSDSTNPYSAEVSRSAQQELAAEGYLTILYDAARNPDLEREYLEILLETRVAGCIVMSAADDATYFEKFSRRRKLPIVLVDSLKSAVLDSVRVDNFAGALHGVAYLASCGYRRIAMPPFAS